MISGLSDFPQHITEHILKILPGDSLAKVRQLNKDWYIRTNCFVTKFRPKSLTQFLREDVSHQYSGLVSVDFSLVDILDDAQLRRVASALAGLPKLEEITIRCGNKVTQHGMASLGVALPQLSKLKVQPSGRGRNRCTVYEASPLAFSIHACSYFPKLAKLDMSWNHVTVDAIQPFASLPQLESLSLKNCIGVDDDVVEELTLMTGLRVLNLSSTNVTDHGLMMINDLELEVLDVSKCEGITDDGLYHLHRNGNLRLLDVSSCPGITSAGVEHLSALPLLETLYLQDIKKLGTSFFKNMKALKQLSLRDCHWVTDSSMEDLACCLSLDRLSLRNCDRITDLGLKSLMKLQNLKSINLRGCVQVTDIGVVEISKLESIEDVDLSFLNQITDESVRALASARNLRRLILNWCISVTSEGLHSLQCGGNRLTELSIKGFHNMECSDLVSMANCTIEKLDYEHSLCSASAEEKELPAMRHIDSVGCFLEIC